MIARTCHYCGQDSSVDLDPEDERYLRWRGGELVQDVWPEKPIEWRERLISGTHDHCWKKLFDE